MSEQTLAERQLRQCTHCQLLSSLYQFEKNRKGEYFKQCNSCRQVGRQRNKHYQDKNKAVLKERRVLKSQLKREIQLKQFQNAMDVELSDMTSELELCKICNEVINRDTGHCDNCHLKQSMEDKQLFSFHGTN